MMQTFYQSFRPKKMKNWEKNFLQFFDPRWGATPQLQVSISWPREGNSKIATVPPFVFEWSLEKCAI